MGLASRMGGWLAAAVSWAAKKALGPRPDEEEDLPTPAQNPLTDESLKMMAPVPRTVQAAPTYEPLEGSVAARYREAQRKRGER